jgi:diketogulonate reductase-like aldo/keto reductase
MDFKALHVVQSTDPTIVPMTNPRNPARRRILGAAAGLALVAGFRTGAQADPAASVLTRRIPSSGEALPAIGMGSWLTFDVGDDGSARAVRLRVLEAFFQKGGSLVDSSPMYGSSEEVIGWCLERLGAGKPLFSATKVWTYGRRVGVDSMERSRSLWGVPRFDLMQVHNLLDWESHLETLKSMKAEGRLRHIGITTSHGRRHDEMERVMLREPLDFVQFTYNIEDREAERRLLPLAAERGIAVIVNRPFQRGALFDRVAGKPLPGWATEFGAANWAQFFLKFAISHPAVTCAIPATSRVDHMLENMGTLGGRLPEADERRRMIEHFRKTAA